MSAWLPVNLQNELLYSGSLSTKGISGTTRLTDLQRDPNNNQRLSAYIEQKLPHDQTIMANIGWGRGTGTSRRTYTEEPDSRAIGDEYTSTIIYATKTPRGQLKRTIQNHGTETYSLPDCATPDRQTEHDISMRPIRQ